MPAKKIDLKKTRKKGKKICESYETALEIRRLDMEENYILSSSIITVSSDKKIENTIEKMYIEFAKDKALYEDAASIFLQTCSKISKIDGKCGDFLIYKYFFSKTEDTIQFDILDVPKREFIYIKNKSYEYVAHIFGEVVFYDE